MLFIEHPVASAALLSWSLKDGLSQVSAAVVLYPYQGVIAKADPVPQPLSPSSRGQESHRAGHTRALLQQ